LVLLTSCASWSPSSYVSTEAAPRPGEIVASKDPDHVVAAIGNEVRVVDVVSGAIVARATIDAGQPALLAVSPDGSKIVVGTWDGTLTALSLRGRRLEITRKRQSAQQHALVALAFSPDGAWLAAMQQYEGVSIFPGGDLGREPMRVGLVEGPLEGAFFRPDGDLVVVRPDSVDRFHGPPFVPVGSTSAPHARWIVDPDGEPLELKRQCEHRAWSRDGEVLACIDDGLVLCTDPSTCKEIAMPAAVGVPQCISDAPDGFVVGGEGPVAATVGVHGDVHTFFVDGVIDTPAPADAAARQAPR
jgi:hypothetical protein